MTWFPNTASQWVSSSQWFAQYAQVLDRNVLFMPLAEKCNHWQDFVTVNYYCTSYCSLGKASEQKSVLHKGKLHWHSVVTLKVSMSFFCVPDAIYTFLRLLLGNCQNAPCHRPFFTTAVPSQLQFSCQLCDWSPIVELSSYCFPMVLRWCYRVVAHCEELVHVSDHKPAK